MTENETRLSPAASLRRPVRRNRRLLWLAPALCAVFAAGCLLVSGILSPESSMIEAESQTAAAFFQLVAEGAGTPVSVQIEMDGESYAVAQADGVCLLDGSAEDVDDARAEQMLACGASILARSRLEGDPEEFGVTEDSPSAVFTYADGSSLTIRFGNEPATGAGRYACVEGAEEIYVVNASLYQTLTAGRNALLALPDFSEVYTSQTLMEVTIEQPDRETIALRRVTESNPFNNVVEFIQPIHYPANSERTASLFIALEELTPQSVLAESGNAADYGLDAPAAVLTLTGASETLQLTIGISGEDYVLQVAGDDRIYALADGAADFLQTATVAYLAEQLPGLVALNQVDELLLTRGGEAYTLRIDRSGDEEAYLLEGRALNGDDFRDLYQQAIGLLIDQYAKGGVDADQVRASFTYTLTDGTTWTLAFAEYDDSYDVVVRDGEACFLIARSKVDAVFESAAELAGTAVSDAKEE